MKKFLLALVAITLGLYANAQISIHAGYANTTFHKSVEYTGNVGPKISRHSNINSSMFGPSNYGYGYSGFYLGFTDYYNIKNHFGFEFGLNYIFIPDDEFNQLTLNIPIEASFRIPFNNSLSLTLLAGPSFDFALFSDDYFGFFYDEYPYDYCGDYDDVKQFNLILQTTLRLNYNHWGLNLTYQYGLLNILDKTKNNLYGLTEHSKIKESRFLAGLSYAF